MTHHRMRNFFYPDHWVTVKAESQAEADKKLNEILKPKPAKKNELPQQD